MTESCRQHLIEHIRDWRTAEVHIDAERRLVANIALAGLHSRNGYRYAEPALREAVPLYENKPVFLDHAANIARPQDRSTRDLVGHIVNPRYQDGRIRGDVRVIETEAGRTFLALAESLSPTVGMSHVVLAERSADRTVIERIHEVVSVDAVAFPATTSTFRESGGTAMALPPAGSLEALLVEIDARLPSHVRHVLQDGSLQVRRIGLFDACVLAEVTSPADIAQLYRVEWSGNDDGIGFGESLQPVSREQIDDPQWSGNAQATDAALRSLRVERDRLQADNEQLRREVADHRREREAGAKRQDIEQLLRESQLPAFAATDDLKRDLSDAPDAAARRRVINDRRTLLRRLAEQAPHSRERSGRPDVLPDAAFVAAIRRPRASVLG